MNTQRERDMIRIATINSWIGHRIGKICAVSDRVT